METYKNGYTKNEDEILWEIHKIRNQLYKETKSKSIEQINKEALKKFSNWKKNKDRLSK